MPNVMPITAEQKNLKKAFFLNNLLNLCVLFRNTIVLTFHFMIVLVIHNAFFKKQGANLQKSFTFASRICIKIFETITL